MLTCAIRQGSSALPLVRFSPWTKKNNVSCGATPAKCQISMDQAQQRHLEAKDTALKIMHDVTGSGGSLPQLVVLDLDYTIWPLYCDCHSPGHNPRLFQDARPIMDALREKGVPLAVASRTPTPETAAVFLRKLSLEPYFEVKEMYPTWTHKTEHFSAITKKTGVNYDKMLFFDDEDRNTITIQKLGVTCVLVDDGLTIEAFRDGIRAYSENQLQLR